MGLIKWLKKDSTTRLRRRESAPPIQTHESFDPNKTCDDSYREKLAKFNQYRTNERVQRLSMGPNDMSGYQTISDDTLETENSLHQPPERKSSLQMQETKPKLRRSNATTDEDIENEDILNDRPKSKKFTVQFYLNESTDESESNYTRRRVGRHSMPASAQNTRKHKLKRSKDSFHSHTIHEEEIKEFEGAHCYGSDSMNGDDERQSNGYRSPPMKFYKQNSNPYPSNSDSNTSNVPRFNRMAVKCPEKPKRLLLNSNESRKVLADAHFNGSYKNFEIKSPYFSEDSSTNFSFTAMQEKIHRQRRNSRDSLIGDSSSQIGRYQVIVNKHGDEVEYALPCIDQQPEYQRRQIPDKCLTSDDSIVANEVFQEDPNECERIINQNFESDSMASQNSLPQTPHHEQLDDFLRKRNRVMITDLDKSTDSGNTLDELNTTPKYERNKILLNNVPIRAANRVLEFYETMQCADVICLISECNAGTGDEHNTTDSPLYYEKGTFKQNAVTIRKYADDRLHDDDKDYSLVAETAILRDLDVLRKIRHPNVINLMAIAFEPFRRVALILEPTKYSLSHYSYQMKGELNAVDIVQIVKNTSNAAMYLQELGFCHSNISSHSILVGKDLNDVKLTSFELTVPYKSDIQSEVDMQNQQKCKRTPSVRRSNSGSPNKSMTNEEKLAKYQQYLNQEAKKEPKRACTIPFIRNINAKYLPYCVEYRQQLSVFNYQAPELLSTAEHFVFPNKQSDVYGLVLLLWEMVNRCIPYVIYDEAKLSKLFELKCPLKLLPKFKETEHYGKYQEIFEACLKREPNSRMKLETLIKKLDSTADFFKNNANDAKTKNDCECRQSSNANCFVRRPDDIRKANDVNENFQTPDKSTTVKQMSMLASPKPSPVLSPPEKTISPLNNVANTTLYRSILDFNKLLSPRRAPNANNIYERSSTLKRRKKVTPTNQHNQNECEQLNENVELDCLSPDTLNNAHTKSTISKALDYSNDEDVIAFENDIENVISPIVDADAKKVNEKKPFNDVSNESHSVRPINGSYQFVIDNYELPDGLIARNNKITRCTWLSSDQVNMTNTSTQYECPKVVASSTQTRDDALIELPSPNDSFDSNKKFNVSIKIVHKQLSPVQSISHNESIKSDCTTISADNSEESFSVKSRIKFFRSLENKPQERRRVNKSYITRRSEISFNDAKKAIEKVHRHTFPAVNPSSKNDEVLLKEICEITAEIKQCLAKNAYLNGKDKKLLPSAQQINLLNTDDGGISMGMLIGDILNQKHIDIENTENVQDSDDREKRHSVKDTVRKFETSLKNDSFPFMKIENKLFNDKIINTEPKLGSFKGRNGVNRSGDSDHDDLMVEKVEDVMRIEAPSENENECGAQVLELNTTPTSEEVIENETAGNHHTQTLIKRTFYQESFISGTNVEMPELKELLLTPNVQTTYATTTKSSMTTCVTLNMRKCRRRSSDVGSIAHQSSRPNIDIDVSSGQGYSPRMPDVRHSICGSPILIQKSMSGADSEQCSNGTPSNSIQMANDQLQMSTCSINLKGGVFQNKRMQSIEDLYIDDDFGGMSLAANMKLMTNSIDSLDNINFDLISTRIFEQTSESMMATALTSSNSLSTSNLKAIENTPADAIETRN